MPARSAEAGEGAASLSGDILRMILWASCERRGELKVLAAAGPQRSFSRHAVSCGRHLPPVFSHGAQPTAITLICTSPMLGAIHDQDHAPTHPIATTSRELTTHSHAVHLLSPHSHYITHAERLYPCAGDSTRVATHATTSSSSSTTINRTQHMSSHTPSMCMHHVPACPACRFTRPQLTRPRLMRPARRRCHGIPYPCHRT